MLLRVQDITSRGSAGKEAGFGQIAKRPTRIVIIDSSAASRRLYRSPRVSFAFR
jgi:hypothetical protein